MNTLIIMFSKHLKVSFYSTPNVCDQNSFHFLCSRPPPKKKVRTVGSFDPYYVV